MGDIVFLGRLKDCHSSVSGCFYIDTDSFSVSNAQYRDLHICYDYDKIETFLSQNGYEAFRKINSIFSEKIVSSQKMKIVNILTSDEAANYFEEKIIPSEKEWVKKKWSFSEKDVENIFESYVGEYQDRSIISAIFSSLEQFGKEKAEDYISSNNDMYKYINFTKYAEDLLSEQPYNFVKTEDGRVVELMY